MTGGVLYMCTVATVVCYKLTCAAVVGCPKFFKPLLTLSTPLYLVVCFISVLFSVTPAFDGSSLYLFLPLY